MEARFGYDFNNVRVHSDGVAERSAAALNARAYTTGRDIFFAAGEYSPHTNDGEALLAHELVHVLQQRGDSAEPRSLIGQRHPAELEAQSVSRAVAEGRASPGVRVASSLGSGSVALQLDPRKVYCMVHAAVCLGLSENPPAAALCWANFAARCGGAMASTGDTRQSGEAAAAAPSGETDLTAVG